MFKDLLVHLVNLWLDNIGISKDNTAEDKVRVNAIEKAKVAEMIINFITNYKER